MNFSRLFTDDEAVSPVIGVILMVAITVILAAVIGTFVLGLGDQVQSTAPNANFAFDQTDRSGLDVDSASAGTADFKQVTITHTGGESVPESNLKITVEGQPAYGVDESVDPFTSTRLWAGSGDVTAGSSVTVSFYDTDGPDATTDFTTSQSMSDDGSDNLIASGGPGDVAELTEDDEVRVLWTSDDGSQSATIGKTTVG